MINLTSQDFLKNLILLGDYTNILVPTLQFSQPTYQVNEDGSLVGSAITVTRTGNTDLTATVTLNLTDGTATAPADYDNTPITVNFAVGQTQATITIPIVNDTLPEDDETLTISLVNPSNSYSLGGQSTATLTIIDDDGGIPSFPALHQLLEIFAKDSVYEDWQIGQDADLDFYPDSGYIVDEVFNDLSTGFYGLGLVNTNPSLAPILVLRGTEFTEGYGDILSDLNPLGIGYDQFSRNSENVFTWLNNNDSILFPHITGHSLGGALAQYIAANYTSSTEYTGILGEVVTFNSPGISTSEANKFNVNAGKAEGVTHYQQIGDLISMAGGAYIDGNAEYDVKLFSYDNFLSAINFQKHVVPMLVDRTSGYVKPDYDEPLSITSAELSNPSFSYYDYVAEGDNNYRWLEFIVSGLDSQLAPNILKRGTIENSRQAIANIVKTALDNLNNAGKIELPDLSFAIGNDFNPDQLLTLGDDITENAIFALKSEDVSLRYVDGEVPYYLINGKLTGSTSLLNNVNGLEYDGDIENENLTGSIDFGSYLADLVEPDKYIKISPTRIDLVGEFSLENLVIAGIGIQEFVIKVDTEKNEIKGDFKLLTPLGIDISGGAGWVQNPETYKFELDDLSAGFLNLDIPVPSLSGVYFQDITVGLENFSKSAPDPLAFSIDTRFTYGSNKTLEIQIPSIQLPDWAGGRIDFPVLAELDLEGTLTTEYIRGGAELKLIGNLAHGQGEIEFNWNKKYIEGFVDLEMFGGIAQIDASVDINLANGDFSLLGTGSLRLPEVRALGVFGLSGLTLASASSYSVRTNDGDNSNDFWAGWGEIFLFGEKGIRIDFDGSFSVIGAREINAITSDFGIQTFAMASFSFAEDSIQPLNVNIPIEETFPVDAQLPWIAFVANWENALDAEIELIAPDGTVYTEADIALSETINVVDQLSTDTSQVIHVANPQLGNWSIRIVNSDSVGNVEFSSFTEANPPTLAINTIESSGNGNFIINYEVGNTGGSQTQYTFYVDDNQEGFDGLIIGNGIKINDGIGSFIWDGDGIAAGEYYIYGVITSDNTIPAFSNYSISTINTDNETPAVNLPPSAVNFLNPLPGLAENTVIGTGIKVADLEIIDDGLGTNRLGLTGTDAASFAIQGTELFYIGPSPNFEDKNQYQVSVTVDDPTVGTSPDASANFILTILDVNEAPFVQTPLGDQTVNVGTPFNFTVPANSFGDADGDALFYTAVLPDGTTPLPAWLSFNDQTLVFSGTPSLGDVGTLSVGIFANDGFISTFDVFDIVITNTANQPGTIQFNNSAYSVNEDGTAVSQITLVRTGGNEGAISVRVTPSNGNATSPADFNNAFITVNFADGETIQTVNIPIVDDDLVESNETVNLTLSNPTGGANLGLQTTAILTIIDNDSAPTNLPPRAVNLLNPLPGLAENTAIGTGIKVADLEIIDDGLGTNRLGLTGTDAASFAIQGTELFYIGPSPNFEDKNQYQVSVTVDDPTVGTSPDASANFILTILDINKISVTVRNGFFFVQLPEGQEVGLKFQNELFAENIFGNWQILEAETVDGINQVLWQDSDTNQFGLWNADANWNWVSSETWPANTLKTLEAEVTFQIDLNNDLLLGDRLTNVETKGNVSLLEGVLGNYYAQTGDGLTTPIKYLGEAFENNLGNWQALAAETVDGINQVLWQDPSSGEIGVWNADSNWNWISSDVFAPGSPGATAQGAIFAVDINGGIAV